MLVKILRQYDKITFFDPYEADNGLDSVIYKCLLTKIPASIKTVRPFIHLSFNYSFRLTYYFRKMKLHKSYLI